MLAVIPARAGSKGIPRKNIKMLGDKPLVAHTICAAQQSKYLDHIHVSTDDEDIKKVAELSGIKVPFLRDSKHAQDDVPNIPDMLVNAIDELKRIQNYSADIVLLLEPTYPFRTTSTIDRALLALVNSEADWVVTVSKTKEHPLRMRRYDSRSKRIYPFLEDKDLFVQRQEFDDLHNIKGAVYAARIGNVAKDLRKCTWEGITIDHLEAIDIDEEFDFRVAQALIAEGKD